MVVTVPLFAEQLNPGFGIEDVKACYAAKYTGPIVKYTEAMDEGGFIDSNALAGKDSMEVAVFGNAERMLLVSRFDNLGKGASGAAVQNMNLMLGVPETLFTPLFAVARMAGWSAHRMEELFCAHRIIRPAYRPVIEPLEYKPLADR